MTRSFTGSPEAAGIPVSLIVNPLKSSSEEWLVETCNCSDIFRMQPTNRFLVEHTGLSETTMGGNC